MVVKNNEETTKPETQPKYEQMETELLFTDGEKMSVAFNEIDDCLEYIRRRVCEDYTDSIRIYLS